MEAKKPGESSERKPDRPRRSTARKAHGDDAVTRHNTAKDSRGQSGTSSEKAKEGAAGPLRVGTAKNWRGKAGAPRKKAKKEAAGPLRAGTAKDWRGKSGSPSKAKKKAAGPLRSGTAKDWRAAGAKKPTKPAEKAASATGRSSMAGVRQRR